MEREKSKLRQALPLLNPKLRGAIELIPEIESARIQEIRLRNSRFLTVTIFDKEYFVTSQGKLSNFTQNAVSVTEEDIDFTFKSAFQYSLHSFQRELSQGFITTQGGNRVGICGTAVTNHTRDFAVESVKYIAGINIRIAREIIGISNEIMQRVFGENQTTAKGLLIIGAPSSGKTTVLRDLTRQLGSQMRVSVIDERGEIASSFNGSPQNDVGAMTDVFNAYPKYDGIMTAVKVMSPKIIICDEIGAKEDLKALEFAVNSGVKLIATTHSSSFEEAKRRAVVSRLVKEGVFDYAVVLGTGVLCSKPVQVVSLSKQKVSVEC